MRFRPFKKNNGIIRYRTVACPQGKCAAADLAHGGDLLWVPRLFVVCSITGTCILDADGMCAGTSILGRIAISSRGIYEGLCAVPNEEVFIELSSGELLTYLPRDSKLGYCAFTPKGMCSAWLPTLKELYKQISQCAKWLSFTETLLQQSADTMLAEYTASTMTSTPDKHDGKHKDQGRLQHLIADMRDSLRRQFEESKFWDAFRRIKAAAESGKSDYPKWIFGPSVWQLGVTLWIEVVDGEKETGSKIAPLENLEKCFL